MTEDDDLFDAAESEYLKQMGMAIAAGNNWIALELGRRIASALGRRDGEITADDVGRILKSDYNIESLGYAAGSLFKTKDWEWTGKRRMSSRKTNHRRELKVWRYIGR